MPRGNKSHAIYLPQVCDLFASNPRFGNFYIFVNFQNSNEPTRSKLGGNLIHIYTHNHAKFERITINILHFRPEFMKVCGKMRFFSPVDAIQFPQVKYIKFKNKILYTNYRTKTPRWCSGNIAALQAECPRFNPRVRKVYLGPPSSLRQAS